MDPRGFLLFGGVILALDDEVNSSVLTNRDFVNIPDVYTSLVLTSRACQSKKNCRENQEHRDFFMWDRGDKNTYRLIKVTEGEKLTFECQSLSPTGVTVTKNNQIGQVSQIVISSEAFNDCLDDFSPSWAPQPTPSIWTFQEEDFTINHNSRVTTPFTPMPLQLGSMAPGLVQALSVFMLNRMKLSLRFTGSKREISIDERDQTADLSGIS
ncbi:hypothetical protein TREMEDRAFT_63734 [Tremella mesenterica DSM 1558]|uniref:uncharacterized protein n=1 Tax=Tremella mesenterica (strain ATCC 24925 / CBS 8224 / DSM 1558 / NBRC 9311 / NRRL Y-6157 / RJB 2259-6 / UBC 559-6) TaxID=578456 RepID=UPI0003F497D3|nr:uncharacterized protein TREMEDRAFT_63734 [Tremella mesenterica DSM 1558]EIW67843.1 hypothetical protein TREMEDRAFT_63734 [Tremella mesenterica DSM 1558]